MKTIAEIVNQSTNSKEGGLRTGTWTTKLANDVNSGKLSIETDGVTSVKFGDHAYMIDNNVIALRSLFESYSGAVPVTDLLSLMQNNYLNTLQKTTAETTKTGEVTETTPLANPKKVLSSDQLEWNYFQLTFADKAKVAAISDLLTKARHALTHDKITKTDLLGLLDELVESIYPKHEFDVVEESRRKEKEEQEKFLALTSAGITNITPINNKGKIEYYSEVTMVDFDKAIVALSSSGFVFLRREFHKTDLAKLVIIFEQGETEKLV